MNKKGLDEMQLQRKYRIGNSCFMLLLYLLLLDTGLYGFGFRWVGYPANIMIILTLCCGIYVVRLIAGGAYVGPYAKYEKPVLRTVLMVLCSVCAAGLIIVFFKNAGFSNPDQVNDMSAPILLISSITALIIAAVTGVIIRKQNKGEGE